MKVYYLSITSFSDVDMGILHHLTADAALTYGVVIQKRNANYRREELQSYCTRHGVSLETFSMKYLLKDPRCLIAFFRVIMSIRKHNPDVLYMVAFDNIYLSLCSLLLNRRKAIVALHDVEFHSNTSFILPLKLSRFITMRFFRNFQVFSQDQLRTFQRLYPRKKVSLIPLPLKDFGNGTAGLKKHPGVIRFLFFGNILHYKGLDLLLAALNEVAGTHPVPEFELVVAGRSGDWDTVYEPMIADKRLVEKHIRFIGNEEVANFFIHSHYLVLPYRDATQSGPLKIAFHYNVPVIASDISSFREEVTHGVDGYLFRTGDADDLKNVLLHALARHATDYQRLKAAQARYVRSRYSPERVRQDFLALWREAE